MLVLRRPGPHIYDERLDRSLPGEILRQRPTVVFPSVHRSESGIRCLTVHPIGNLGPSAELGGRPRTVVPTDPAAMSGILGRLAEEGARLGLPATYEATHHGPELELPACFVEIAVPEGARPEPAEVAAVDRAVREGSSRDGDLRALAVGGGHYAPRFTDLARGRRWAFGHIVPRHALPELDRATARAVLEGTPGAQGVLYARAADRGFPALEGLAPELRDAAAPRRGAPAPATSGRSTSGT